MAQGWAAIKNPGEIPQHVNLPKCWRRVSRGLLLIAIKTKDFIREWWRNRGEKQSDVIWKYATLIGEWPQLGMFFLESDYGFKSFDGSFLPLTATEDNNVWNGSVCETPPPSTTSWSLWGLVRLSLCRHNCLNSVFFDNSVLNTITPPQQVR